MAVTDKVEVFVWKSVLSETMSSSFPKISFFSVRSSNTASMTTSQDDEVCQVVAADQCLLGELSGHRVELSELHASVEEAVNCADAPLEVGFVDVEEDRAVTGASHHRGDARPHGAGAEDGDGLVLDAHSLLLDRWGRSERVTRGARPRAWSRDR